jgi:uncharacterized protein (TIGR00251 family)
LPAEATAAGIRLRLKVAPKAKRNALAGLLDEPDGRPIGQGRALKVAVTAAPEGGKANDAVIALLAKEFGVAKSAISVVAGATDRRKIVEIRGQSGELMQRAAALVADQEH